MKDNDNDGTELGVGLVNFRDWKHFKSDLFDELVKQQGGTTDEKVWLFRGQQSSAWNLTSSFDRLCQERSLTYQSGKMLFDKAMRVFYQNGFESGVFSQLKSRLNDPNEFSTIQSDASLYLELRELAQHYGVPTNLLDWTSSVYVAAFFATTHISVGASSSGYLSIWCLDVDYAKYVFDQGSLKITSRVVTQEARKVWQRASFTENLTDCISLNEMSKISARKFMFTPSYNFLIECRIPVTCASEISRDLSMMRIDYVSIYPDMEGLVRHVNREAFDR
jgi:FRG domain